MTEERVCTIPNCWCKCKTKQEFKNWTFDAIESAIFSSQSKSEKERIEAYTQAHYLLCGYHEMLEGLDE